MKERRLLLWRTGREETWRVQVCLGASGTTGFRDVTGPIALTQGRLLLASYASLTMAASYYDVTLPAAHEAGNVLPLPAGSYRCRVIQMKDPDAVVDDAWILEGIHFVIELVPDPAGSHPWIHIPWAET